MTTTDYRAARTTDTETSQAGADHAANIATLIQHRVWELFNGKSEFGLTDSEMTRDYFLAQDTLGWDEVDIDTPRKRRSELTQRGLVVKLPGVRRNGKQAWVLA